MKWKIRSLSIDNHLKLSGLETAWLSQGVRLSKARGQAEIQRGTGFSALGQPFAAFADISIIRGTCSYPKARSCTQDQVRVTRGWVPGSTISEICSRFQHAANGRNYRLGAEAQGYRTETEDTQDHAAPRLEIKPGGCQQGHRKRGRATLPAQLIGGKGACPRLSAAWPHPRAGAAESRGRVAATAQSRGR